MGAASDVGGGTKRLEKRYAGKLCTPVRYTVHNLPLDCPATQGYIASVEWVSTQYQHGESQRLSLTGAAHELNLL